MEGVVGGRLRLKNPKTGMLITPTAGKPKSHKHKHKHVVQKRIDQLSSSTTSASSRDVNEQIGEADIAGATIVDTEGILGDAVPRRSVEYTDAELSFLLNQAKREKARVEKAAEMTYREKIDEMNKKLANLTEINDMPKIGPG